MQLAKPATDVPAVRRRAVVVEGPNGAFSGRLAVPDRDVWTSAVVVVPDRRGINAQLLRVCSDLALAGHAALAIDVPVSELDAPFVWSSSAKSTVLDRFTASVGAALEFLETTGPAPPSRFGVVGYGAGGVVALAAGYRGYRCQVGAAVSFYGEGTMRLHENLARIINHPKPQAATFLCLIGAADQDVRAQDVGQIARHFEAFGMRCNAIVYPRTQAGFCDPDDPRYRPVEAEDAWKRLLHALETAARRRHRFTGKRKQGRKTVDPVEPVEPPKPAGPRRR